MNDRAPRLTDSTRAAAPKDGTEASVMVQGEAAAAPLISCLCVTENRPAFLSWLLWSFERQTHPRRELVIIDSSSTPCRIERRDVSVLAVPPGCSVPVKRNRALEAAGGSIVTWFDDDDWQHPERLARLARALDQRSAMAGATCSWFVDPFTERCRPHDGRGNILFNGAGFGVELARSVRFDERLRRASDTPWLHAVRARCQAEQVFLDPVILSFWLCHDSNLSNSRGLRRPDQALDVLRDAVGQHAWGDTDQQLRELRLRLKA